MAKNRNIRIIKSFSELQNEIDYDNFDKKNI